MMSGNYHLIFLRWLLLATMIAFLVYLLWEMHILTNMLAADRTWICASITILFIVTSLHCAYRSYLISREHKILLQIKSNLRHFNAYDIEAAHLPDAENKAQSPVARYIFHVTKANQSEPDNLHAEMLSESLRGQHQVGWFITGLVIKLGLLGTVIGFGFMLSSVGSIESLEISNMENLMQNMTQGMGIALNTTMFGLVCSIFLGIQYLFLDRSADGVTVETIDFAEKLKLVRQPPPAD